MSKKVTKELWCYDLYDNYGIHPVFYVVDPEHIVKKVIIGECESYIVDRHTVDEGKIDQALVGYRYEKLGGDNYLKLCDILDEHKIDYKCADITEDYNPDKVVIAVDEDDMRIIPMNDFEIVDTYTYLNNILWSNEAKERIIIQIDESNIIRLVGGSDPFKIFYFIYPLISVDDQLVKDKSFVYIIPQNNDIPAGLIVDDSDIEKIKDEIRTNGELSIDYNVKCINNINRSYMSSLWATCAFERS